MKLHSDPSSVRRGRVSRANVDARNERTGWRGEEFHSRAEVVLPRLAEAARSTRFAGFNGDPVADPQMLDIGADLRNDSGAFVPDYHRLLQDKRPDATVLPICTPSQYVSGVMERRSYEPATRTVHVGSADPERLDLDNDLVRTRRRRHRHIPNLEPVDTGQDGCLVARGHPRNGPNGATESP